MRDIKNTETKFLTEFWFCLGFCPLLNFGTFWEGETFWNFFLYVCMCSQVYINPFFFFPILHQHICLRTKYAFRLQEIQNFETILPLKKKVLKRATSKEKKCWTVAEIVKRVLL